MICNKINKCNTGLEDWNPNPSNYVIVQMTSMETAELRIVNQIVSQIDLGSPKLRELNILDGETLYVEESDLSESNLLQVCHTPQLLRMNWERKG